MSGIGRNSKLEVLVEKCWYPVSASIDETALTLYPADEGFDIPAAACIAWAEKRFVKIQKQDEGQELGISIQGGAENNRRPIVISKIIPGMPADQTRQLFVGDVILAVNGESLINATHKDAVRALIQSGKVVNLQVQYSSEHLRKTSSVKKLDWDDEEQHVPADSRELVRSFNLKLAFVLRS